MTGPSNVAEIFAAMGAAAPHAVLARALAAARRHLGLELVFVADIGGEIEVFRAGSDGDELDGASSDVARRIEMAFCAHVLAGEIADLVARSKPLGDLARLDEAARAAVAPSYSVPIVFSNGVPFGMLCLVGSDRSDAEGMSARDVSAMGLVAQLIADQLEGQQDAWRERCERVLGVRSQLAGALRVEHQPIVDFVGGRVIGAEALARFHDDPSRSPQAFFRDAWAVGYGAEAELMALGLALRTLPQLPIDRFLSVNVSPSLPEAPGFRELLESVDLRRVVLEFTEHSRLPDALELALRLQPLRAAGLRIAVDDAGAGFAGLHHIVDLAPDFIKLDAGLVRSIDSDATRAALVKALVHFASLTSSTIIAEGVEHASQADALRALGIVYAQGYLFGRPAIP